MKIVTLLLLFVVPGAVVIAQPSRVDPIPGSLIGRWDLVVHQSGREVPSWLEVQRSGIKTLVGRFVGGGGSARPISKVFFNDGHFYFAIPPQWEREDSDLVVEGSLQGDSLTGSMVMPNGKQYSWSGHRAPGLVRSGMVKWGSPE